MTMFVCVISPCEVGVPQVVVRLGLPPGVVHLPKERQTFREMRPRAGAVPLPYGRGPQVDERQRKATPIAELPEAGHAGVTVATGSNQVPLRPCQRARTDERL